MTTKPTTSFITNTRGLLSEGFECSLFGCGVLSQVPNLYPPKLLLIVKHHLYQPYLVSVCLSSLCFMILALQKKKQLAKERNETKTLMKGRKSQ